MRDAFEQFDGKSTQAFRKVADRDPSESDWAEVVRLAGDPDPRCQIGATWVVKHWLDSGCPLPEPVGRELLTLVGYFDAPTATLHVLQVFDRLPIEAVDSELIIGRLEALSEADHTFVRAWAFSAMVVLANRYEGLRESVLDRIELARTEDSASVRARLRQMSKKYKWCQPE